MMYYVKSARYVDIHCTGKSTFGFIQVHFHVVFWFYPVAKAKKANQETTDVQILKDSPSGCQK
jgi:hypothetical protein